MVLFPQTHTVIRQNPSKYVNGQYIETGTTTINITADIQPYQKSEHIELGNIGRKSCGTIKIFTDAVLYYTKEEDLRKPDLIIFQGETYELINVEKHRGNILSNTVYIGELRTGKS